MDFLAINIQVWQDDLSDAGTYYYSITKEFDESGKDTEPCVWGEADSKEEALAEVARELPGILG